MKSLDVNQGTRDISDGLKRRESAAHLANLTLDHITKRWHRDVGGKTPFQIRSLNHKGLNPIAPSGLAQKPTTNPLTCAWCRVHTGDGGVCHRPACACPTGHSGFPTFFTDRSWSKSLPESSSGSCCSCRSFILISSSALGADVL